MPLDGDGDAPVHGVFERVINQVAYYLFHLALVRLDGVLMRFVDFLFESQATQLRVRNVAVRNRRSGCGEVERSAVVRYLPDPFSLGEAWSTVPSTISDAYPRMAVIGLRISCDANVINSDFSSLSR